VKKKKIIILGATGSIGENAFKVARSLKSEFEVVGLVARNSLKRLAEQAFELDCHSVVTTDVTRIAELRTMVHSGCAVDGGEDAVLKMVTALEVDLILCAIVGTGGLLPVISALRAGKDIALASKEVLVMAGELVMREAEKNGCRIIPVDSEHSAIFQCLEGRKKEDVARLILTASGGAFRDSTREEMEMATYEKALAHPTWDMGPKVTIDSTTMMNKALEIVEAGYLFGIPPEKIDVVIHPQSIIHSMVEFVDGSILAQLSKPDMRFPIQYALTYPARLAGEMPRLNFSDCLNLSFQKPDRKRFPSLDFAYAALRSGGTMPAVMNAANEIAVEKFRKGEIAFTGIWSIIEKVMSLHQVTAQSDLTTVLAADGWARQTAASLY